MKNGCNVILFLVLLNILHLSLVDATCTFPSVIRGNWISSDKGTLNFTSDTIWRYPLPVTVSVQQVDLVCNSSIGDTYMLRSKNTVELFNLYFYIYICFEMHLISSHKYWYQVANEIDTSTQLRFRPFLSTIKPNFTEACNRAEPFSVSTFNTLLQEGALEDGLIEATCPFELFHKFSNGILTSADRKTTCRNTTLDICTERTQMRLTYDNSCATSLKIASEGLNICLLDRTNDTTGVTYLHVWNNDTSLATGFQRINCYAFEKRNDTMVATLYPGACKENQTADSVYSPGIYIQYTNITKTCQDTAAPGPQTLYYVAIILGGVGFIIIVIVIICIICKTKCRCCTKSCSKNKIGHSKASLTASMEEGMAPYLQAMSKADVPRRVFVPRKAIKIGPIIEPYLQPPPKVELLYDIEPRPTSSRLMFTRSVFFSQISLRQKDVDSPSGIKIEQLDY